MANALKGEVQVVFQGRTVKLVLDYDALALVETRLDLLAGEVVDQIRPARVEDGKVKAAPRMKLEHLRALFWAALQKHQPDIAFDSLGAGIYAAGVPTVSMWVVMALAAGMPQAGDVDDDGDGDAGGEGDGAGPRLATAPAGPSPNT